MTAMDETEEKTCVLVVDDHLKVLRFMEIDLRLRGFDVLTAASGEEALDLVKTADPDVMLLDIIMPQMDGREVLRKLRDFSQVPVIAFSASPGNRDEAIRLGADSFVSKPFRPDEMARIIEELASR